MHDRTVIDKGGLTWGAGGSSREAQLKRKYPTVEDLRKRAKTRVPGIGFDAVEGGTGQDLGVLRNAAALDAIEIVPRYGDDREGTELDVELFGRHYSAPLGVAPMGLQGLMWPGAERHLARAAQRARIPYTAGTVSGVSLEELAAIAPDVIWFQLYRLAANNHAVGFDLVARAEKAGVHVLVITVDTPSRAKRPRELRQGLVIPFRPSLRTIYEAATSPHWLMALSRNGQPTFPNLARYASTNPGKGEVAGFAQREVRGAMTWEEIARYRDRWKRPMVIKGIMHPADAEKAVSLGIDGVQVSNHGGRQLEAAPASVDVLPAIAAAVGARATILHDGGVRSGLDVLRSVALGAKAALAGRAFLYAVGALGGEGADYVTSLLIEEIRVAMRQSGVHKLADARSLAIRHPGAMSFPPGAI